MDLTQQRSRGAGSQPAAASQAARAGALTRCANKHLLSHQLLVVLAPPTAAAPVIIWNRRVNTAHFKMAPSLETDATRCNTNRGKTLHSQACWPHTQTNRPPPRHQTCLTRRISYLGFVRQNSEVTRRVQPMHNPAHLSTNRHNPNSETAKAETWRTS
jgi:hypothetical protein